MKPEEIVAAFQKDKDAATAQYGTKPIRITGQVKGFNPDHAFAHDQDLFILLTPEGSPCEVYVCFSRPQLETTFRFPADKKPKVTNPSYAGYTRQIEQGYTKPYFDRDLNMIALHDSETLSPPASTAKTGPKPTPVGFSADKIPLVAVGDPIDVDVLFEQAAPDGSVIFNATAIPPAPVKK